MKFPNVARWCALSGLVAALAAAGPALSNPQLPRCPQLSASTSPPVGTPSLRAPRACRAGPPRTPESALKPAALRSTPGGYHHLGAGTSGEWKGVSGRFGVVDGAIRPGTYDFVAARFMVKRDMGGGRINWLEAGWAETGWAGAGGQHVYTFNTNTGAWQFYDQYALKAGDKVWMDLHSDPNGVWEAWLWWGNRWNLLTAQKLPIGNSAFVEQYVEVHVDRGGPALVDVPTVTVDNVQLRPSDGGPARRWRSDVGTLVGDMAAQRAGGLCVNWVTSYDTWTAGDCAPARTARPARPEPHPRATIREAPGPREK